MGKFDQRAEEFGLLVGVHDSARRVEDLPLDWIMPDPQNPRRTFDAQEMQELADSIAARGVLQPISVSARNDDGKHIIRMGERRYRASLLAGRTTIPAIIVPVGDSGAMLADQIVENDQRANLSPLEMATGIERMLFGGASQVEIARALGRSKQFVSLYAAYADMQPYLRAAIDKAPIRVLYDLHRAARTFPDEVRAFVAGFGDSGVTLAEGTKFVAGLKTPAPVKGDQPIVVQTSSSALNGPVPQATNERRPRSGAESAACFQGGPALRVMMESRAGRLLLPDRVRVMFDDGDERDVSSSDLAFE